MSEMAGLAERRENLTREKRAILARWIREGKPAPEGHIGRRDESGAAPLSFAQERLWVLNQLEALGSAYNIMTAFRIRGPLKPAILQRCLRVFVQRHEILRTRFSVVAGGPVQIGDVSSSWALQEEDISHLSSEERDARLAQIKETLGTHRFDLTQGPLFEAVLVKLSAVEHLMMTAVHHIVADGASATIMLQEVKALYAAFVRGDPCPLPELPVQYSDYADWQRRRWRQGGAESGLAFWRTELEGTPEALELPLDHPRPPTQRFRGAVVPFSLPSQLVSALASLAHEQGATLFMVLLAAFQIVLSRWSGQRDFVVGTPISGRIRPELEPLIGCFVNTLPIRASLAGDPTFREFLDRVKTTTLAAYAHQDVPFEKIVDAVRPLRDLSRQPIFQVVLNLQTSLVETPSPEGLTFKLEHYGNKGAKFDLSLQLRQTPRGLRGAMEYATDLFEAATIERLLGRLRVVLEEIVVNADSRISSFSHLSDLERRQLASWNETQADYPSGRCLHELFSEQATVTPDAVAVMFEDRKITYGELEARSNKLARHLQSLGVGPDVVVGLCIDRSSDVVVGVLGILKAGGAYLPVDPADPDERRRYVLKDSAAAVLVVQGGAEGRFASDPARLVKLRDDGDLIARQSAERLDGRTSPENLAYVIYTSGSTGKPKGVMIAHRSVVNYVAGVSSAHDLAGPLQHALVQPITVGSTVTLFYGALLSGGCIHILSRHAALDAVACERYFAAHHIDSLKLAPSHYAALMGSSQVPATLMPARTLIVGGESSLWRWVDELAALNPMTQIVNHYGSTETTVGVLTCRTNAEGVGRKGAVPLGRPLPNVETYVLDDRLAPVPIGTIGELFIGGACLGRGYLSQPGLTAEQFLPNPFRGRGERMYRTGDLVRYRPDGALEFCGRRDRQVKIRGYRVEVGEIEAALSAHSDVHQALVRSVDGAPAAALVAYVVPRKGRVILPETLRAHLRRALPEYMVPARFVFLEEMPRTSHGKLDPKRLPAPDAEAEPPTQRIAPRNAVERKLAEILADVLRHDVGASDNFFDSGGNSLLATQVITRIRDVFGVELPVRAIFEAPVLSDLALRIDATDPGRKRAERMSDNAAAGRNIVPLSCVQERIWQAEQDGSAGSVNNMQLAVRLVGPLNLSALETAFDTIVQRHESLRTRFEVRNGQPVQIVDRRRGPIIDFKDLSRLSSDERAVESRRLLASEAERKFDLGRGRLLSALVVRLAPNEHIMSMAIHHIVCDAWSLGILVRELGAAYADSIEGRPVSAPPLDMQYADFALWQRHWMRSKACGEQLAYWRARLFGAATAVNLPADRGRRPLRSFAGDRVSFDVRGADASALLELARTERATLFMVLLAAFQLLLSLWTRQEDLVVATPVAGRTQKRFEPLIGYFVNRLPIRVDLRGDPTFRELLARVKDATLGAYANQDVPCEMIAAGCGTEPISRPQIVMGLQNTPKEPWRLPGLTVSRIPIRQTRIQRDLSLYWRETPDLLRADLEFSTELFEKSTVERFSEAYRHLLHAVTVHPECKVSDVAES